VIPPPPGSSPSRPGWRSCTRSCQSRPNCSPTPHMTPAANAHQAISAEQRRRPTCIRRRRNPSHWVASRWWPELAQFGW
jgi:hypothetical protein